MIIEILVEEDSRYVLAKTIEDVQGPIPRVGELIELDPDKDFLAGHERFLVYEVCYPLKGNTLTTIVMCTPYQHTVTRESLLEEFGWRS